jgi:hypothetical protein
MSWPERLHVLFRRDLQLDRPHVADTQQARCGVVQLERPRRRHVKVADIPSGRWGGDWIIQAQATPVPEPSSWIFFLTSLLVSAVLLQTGMIKPARR